MKDKWVRKADVLLLLVVGLLGAVLFLYKSSSNENLSAYVYDKNELVHQVLLEGVSKPYQVTCANGTVQIAIERDQVQIFASDCQGQTCVRTGVLTHSGDTAACVPNWVIVVVQGTQGQVYQTY